MIFNSLAGTAGKEDDPRLRILHFAATGGTHEKLTGAVYTSDSKVPYADLVSLAMDGRKGLVVGVQEYFVPYVPARKGH